MLHKRPERVRTGFVLMLLVCAVLVRFILAWGAKGAEEASGQEILSERLPERISLQPRQTVQHSAQEVLPPAEMEAERIFPVFSQTDVQSITVSGASSYQVDLLAALQEDGWRSEQVEPAVLIVHTHGTESYRASPGWEYPDAASLRSQDANYSVIRVGRSLREELEALGIRVIHDETMHDLVSFSGAYAASGQAVAAAMAEHPEISMVIDLHRDAAQNPDGSDFAATLTQNGQRFARLMLVVGTNEGGLEHPDWQMNLSCAVQLQALLNRSMPGLCRDLDLRTERFNQHLSPAALLIEVGAAGNTMPEALASMPVLAVAISELLVGK